MWYWKGLAREVVETVGPTINSYLNSHSIPVTNKARSCNHDVLKARFSSILSIRL